MRANTHIYIEKESVCLRERERERRGEGEGRRKGGGREKSTCNPNRSAWALRKDLRPQVTLLGEARGVVRAGVENLHGAAARHTAGVGDRGHARSAPGVEFVYVLDASRHGLLIRSAVRGVVQRGGDGLSGAVVEVGQAGALGVAALAADRAALGEPEARLNDFKVSKFNSK